MCANETLHLIRNKDEFVSLTERRPALPFSRSERGHRTAADCGGIARREHSVFGSAGSRQVSDLTHAIGAWEVLFTGTKQRG